MNKKTLMVVGVVVIVLIAAGAANRFLTGGQADVSGDGDGVTVKTDDGTWSTSDKLPANFPSDVPVYSGAKVQASVEAVQQGGGNYVALETSDSAEEVLAWYKTEVVSKGWTISSNVAVEGGMMLGAEKDTRNLLVTIGRDSDTTVIGLLVAQQ